MFKDFYLNIKLLYPEAKSPIQAHDIDVGFDVFAPGTFSIQPQKDYKIGLGWCCEFPKNYVMLFTNKSGRAVNDKLIVGADTVDPGYRGEVHCHLFNLSHNTIRIYGGEKISQFLILPAWHGKVKIVTQLNMYTQRGSGRFGSTGLK